MKALAEFATEIKARSTSKSPDFFVKLKKIGWTIAAFSMGFSLILSQVMPEAKITIIVGSISATAGSVMAIVSKLTVADPEKMYEKLKK